MYVCMYVYMGFPGGSDGKESACNSGDLGCEDPQKKGTATHFLPGEFHRQRSLAVYSPNGRKESRTRLRDFHTHTCVCVCVYIYIYNFFSSSEILFNQLHVFHNDT